jgi:hypothetical protein
MTTVIHVGEQHSHKAVLLDVVVHLTSARYGARMRVVGAGFDVEARVEEVHVHLPHTTYPLPLQAWVGVVGDRWHLPRVVALGVWEDRDAVARAVADEMLSVLRGKLAPAVVQRASLPVASSAPGWVGGVGVVVAASSEVAAALRPRLFSSEESHLDSLYDRIDDALNAGEFAAVDREMAAVDVETTDLTTLLGWLTITYSAKEYLPSRAPFAVRVFTRAEREQGAAAAVELLRGLMGDEPPVERW